MKTIHKYKSKDLTINLFEIPIYDFKICFLKHRNNKGYDEALLFCSGIGFNEDIYKTDDYRYAGGFTTTRSTTNGIICFVFINYSKELRGDYINSLAHENYHLVQQICKHHGIKYDEDSDNEPQAYLTGYLLQILYTL